MRSKLIAAVITLSALLSTPPAYGDDWVEKLQRRLNALGCNAGPVDGELGDWTRSAVVRFQSRHRLAMDGVPGPVTRERLYAKKAKRCDERPVPADTGEGRRIVLSQRQNWLWIVGPRGKVQVQGGLVDNPSVLRPGTYRTGSYCGRAARIERNGVASGLLWLDHFVRFAPCGVGFHRIPRYISTGEQMHPDWLLGTNYRESHGCIRLSDGLSRKVWDFTTRATTVRVVWG
ncbi:MAG TPA: peptidoglycan-binding protein [Nocardioidaceae bacterium]|nr:peptidoglycan-binding protein [Nocardioidaceae bacterium]